MFFRYSFKSLAPSRKSLCKLLGAALRVQTLRFGLSKAFEGSFKIRVSVFWRNRFDISALRRKHGVFKKQHRHPK